MTVNQSNSEPPRTLGVGTLKYTPRTLAVLFFWLLWGDFCYILMETIVPQVLPLKFKALGASDTMIALIVVTIPNLINIFVNPFASFRSDRHRSRLGRRIPFLLWTVPPLAVFLVLMGLSPDFGAMLHKALGDGTGWSENTIVLVLLGTFMILFSVFNSVVNAVYWYLFTDVVPEHLLARFMSLFRVVATGAGAVFSYFLLAHSTTHTTAIFIGAAVLYTVGFGVMCLFVKEGKYPPPAPLHGNGKGLVCAVQTYFKECYSLSHYNYVFLIGIAFGATYGLMPYMNFYYQATGLSLEQGEVGTIQAISLITLLVCILFSGWLADRFHPIRVVLVGLIFQLVVALPAQMLWLIWTPDHATTYWVWMIIAVLASGPAGAMIGMLDPPLFMRVFPHERYGQYCSANALVRTAAIALFGLVGGWFFDHLRIVGSEPASYQPYLWMPVFLWFPYLLMLVFAILLYRSWKRRGGDAGYQPPVIS